MSDHEIPFVAQLRGEVRRTVMMATSATAMSRSGSRSFRRLIADVRGPVGRRFVIGRRSLGILSATGATLAAMSIAVVLLLSATTSTPPAWAVTKNRDGTITLTIREVSDLAAVNAKLAQDGIRARIVPFRQACPTVLSLPMRDLQPRTQPWSTANTENGPVGDWTVGIIPSRIPAGRTLVFALKEWDHKGWEQVAGFVKGHLPTCAAPAGNGLTILSH